MVREFKGKITRPNYLCRSAEMAANVKELAAALVFFNVSPATEAD